MSSGPTDQGGLGVCGGGAHRWAQAGGVPQGSVWRRECPASVLTASYTMTRGETAWAQQACPLLNLWLSLSMQGPKEWQGEIRKHSSAISAKK